MESQDLELATAYLNGELESEERKAAEERISREPAFAELLAELRSIREASRLSREAEAGLAALERVAARARKQAPPNRRPWAIAAAVALLGILSVAIWWLNQPGEPNYVALFEESFAPFPNRESTSGPAAAAAYEAYDRGAWSQAVAEFSAIPASDSSHLNAQLYLAISHLHLRKASQAISVLDAYLATCASRCTYFHEAQWHLALAHLLNSELQPARDRLQTISSTTESPYQAQASRLLEQLD